MFFIQELISFLDSMYFQTKEVLYKPPCSNILCKSSKVQRNFWISLESQISVHWNLYYISSSILSAQNTNFCYPETPKTIL